MKQSCHESYETISKCGVSLQGDTGLPGSLGIPGLNGLTGFKVHQHYAHKHFSFSLFIHFSFVICSIRAIKVMEASTVLMVTRVERGRRLVNEQHQFIVCPTITEYVFISNILFHFQRNFYLKLISLSSILCEGVHLYAVLAPCRVQQVFRVSQGLRGQQVVQEGMETRDHQERQEPLGTQEQRYSIHVLSNTPEDRILT